jgi:hypothetical protein
MRSNAPAHGRVVLFEAGSGLVSPFGLAKAVRDQLRSHQSRLQIIYRRTARPHERGA